MLKKLQMLVVEITMLVYGIVILHYKLINVLKFCLHLVNENFLGEFVLLYCYCYVNNMSDPWSNP